VDIEAAIVAKLVDTPAVFALIGTRLYPDQAPEDAAAPFVEYGEASAERRRTMNGFVSLRRWSMHLDIYATRKREAKAVRVAIEAAILGAKWENDSVAVRGVYDEDSESGAEPPYPGDELGLYRMGVDLAIHYRQS